MHFLTGVPGSPLQNLASKIENFNSCHILGDEQKNLSPCGEQMVRNYLEVKRKKCAKKAPLCHHLNHVDVAVDTMDLTMNEGDDDGTDYDALDEAQCRLYMEMEKHGGKKPLTLQDYLEMVKKSTGRIGLRAQLLQELSLGEDVNMGIPDSELPALIPMEKLGTESTKPGESQSKDQETKTIPIYRGAMRATSLVIKRLRRMVIDFGSITSKMLLSTEANELNSQPYSRTFFPTQRS